MDYCATSTAPIVAPRAFLQGLVGSNVIVKLKWGNEYHGILSSYDPYFNIKLNSCNEFVNGKDTGPLGEVLIRCNNIITIREDPSTQR